MSTRGEAIAKAAFKAAHHTDHQPHQPSLGFHEIDLQVGTPQGAPPKVEVLQGKLLITAEGQAQPQEVQLPPEAYTNEITAKWNASTAKLHVRIMLKDPNAPAMLEKQALDPDGPHPKPVEVQVTGRPLTRPPDVVGHGQPTPAQASVHGASTSPAIVGAPAHAVMPDAGLAGTVASDMPTLVHKGGALEAPCSGETVVRDYETADTRMEMPERAIKDISKMTAGMGRMEVGSQAVGQGADVAQLRKAHEPEQRDMARGRTLAPAGATIIQGARERRLEAEFETSDPSYLSAARTAMGLPQEMAPEHGAPTAGEQSAEPMAENVAPPSEQSQLTAEQAAASAAGGQQPQAAAGPSAGTEQPVDGHAASSAGGYGAASAAGAEAPEGTAGEPDLVVPGGDGAGVHKVGGAEAAPERDGVDFDLLKQEGGFPTPSEAAEGVPLGMEGAAVRAAGEDLPETTTVHTAGGAPAASQLEGEDSMSSDGAPEVGAGGALTVADAMEVPGKPVLVTQPQPHALAPAGEADAPEDEEYEDEDEDEESDEEGGVEYFEEFEDEHGVRHVSTDPTKEKVGLATHALTAAERYPRCDDGSVEPVSSTKHQLETGGHGCDVCCCSPCQCGKLRTGQYKASLELSPAETKRMGKPAMHKTKKPDSGKKPLKHTKRDCRMHARTANAAQPHMSMAARTTAWTGDVPQDPAPGLTISAEEVEQEVLHKGSSLRRPDKAREAVQAAIGAHNDNEVVHGAKHHESTYTGGRVIGIGPNIHLSTGRHDKKSHVLG